MSLFKLSLPEGSGAIVLTLRWPSTSFNQAFGDKPWLKQLIEQEHETASMRAIKRWQQLKVLYIEYTHSYRCVYFNADFEDVGTVLRQFQLWLTLPCFFKDENG